MQRLARRTFLKTTGVSAGAAFGLGSVSAEETVQTQQTQSFSATATDGFLTIDSDSANTSDETIPLAGSDVDGSFTIEGEISADGSWESTNTNLPSFTESESELGNDVTVNVDYRMAGSVTGNIDRNGNLMLAEMPLRVDIEMIIDPVIGGGETKNATLIVNANDLTTGQSGDMTGSASGLATQSGTATLVDNKLTIPGTGVSFVDDFFGTPSQTTGRNWMELDLDLNLPPPPEGTLSGTVTDGSGSAVSGVDVVISDSGTGSTVQTVTTDSSGNYSATLEPNDYEVTVNADGYESFSDLTSVTGGQTTTLDITLTESGPSPGTLEGTVTDTSGSAVGSIPIGIYAADADPSTSDPLQITNTDSSGNYSVSRAPDDYKIYIDVDGYNTYTETVTINSGETTTADVQLTDETASPGTVTGTVTDNHGNALDGLTIEFLDATSGDVVKTVTTDSQGSYSVELSPTGYTLSVNASSYESYSTSLTVVDGGSLTQDIQLTVSLPPLPGQSNPPQDADGDGNYEDIRGDGSVDVFDVQTLFANLNDPAVQENSRYFNFQGDDPSEVTIFDVQALFSKV